MISHAAHVSHECTSGTCACVFSQLKVLHCSAHGMQPFGAQGMPYGYPGEQVPQAQAARRAVLNQLAAAQDWRDVAQVVGRCALSSPATCLPAATLHVLRYGLATANAERLVQCLLSHGPVTAVAIKMGNATSYETQLSPPVSPCCIFIVYISCSGIATC